MEDPLRNGPAAPGAADAGGPGPGAGDAATHWDQRYGERDRIWSGRPNVALVAEVSGLPPGRALDLGCGEGADSIWLAERGWAVTAVDVSGVAVGRASQEAAARGIGEGRIEWVVADLASWRPPTTYDLVSACFLHSMIEFPRTEVLRRGADAVAPGGHLLVVGHAAPPPWALAHEHRAPDQELQEEVELRPDPEAAPWHDHHRFLAPADELAELALDPAGWETVVAEVRERTATAPDGEPVTWPDSVVLLRRT